jgi:hypothetical protein
VGSAPVSAVGKACLFAIVWQVGIVLLMRRMDALWSYTALALIAAFFPIVVAVDIGFRAGRESTAGRRGESRQPNAPAPNTKALA